MLLVSLLYWAFLIVALVVLFVPAVVVWALTVPFDRRRVLFHLYTSWWAAVLLWFNPLRRVDVTGRNKIPWRRSAVIVSNHLSLIDILVLFLLYRPFKWVSKIENFSLPITGSVMRRRCAVVISNRIRRY